MQGEGTVDTNPLYANGHITSVDEPNKSSMIELADESGTDRSSWVKDLADDYEFCIVLPLEKGKLSSRSEGYVKKMRSLGFDIFIYTNIHEDEELYILLRTPLDKLKAFADNSNFPLILDSEEIEHRLKADGVEIAHRPDIVSYRPTEKIFGKFSNKPEHFDLYWRDPGMEHPFREIVRLKLTAVILESRSVGGGQSLKIRRYLKSGWWKGCFPLHNRSTTDVVEKKWLRYPFQKLPLTDMKNYFGEKISLNFAFMEHYTFCLSFPAFIGLPFQIAVFATGNYSADFLPYFSFFIAMWSVTMLEFWKRKEKTLALDWGMIDFERNEHDRPDYQGDVIPSFIDGSPMRYFPSNEQNRRLCLSVVSIVGLVLLVTGVVVGIYLMRYFLAASDGGPLSDSDAQTLASICNAVQIQVMNYIYTFIATALTDNERHRTQTQFEDSMIAKIFLFQFVNSYASFFYLAFVAEFVGDCQGEACMSSLAINLAIIFGTRLASGYITGIVLPYITYQMKYRKTVEKSAGKISRPEREFLLQPYDVQSTTLDDYADAAIQFGYMSLFVSALPMAAFFAYVSNIVGIRSNGWKLLNLYQRPIPKGAEDIGNWQVIFLTLAVVAVLTNAGLTCFTMNVLDSVSESAKYWIFILFQWVCFFLQAVIMAVVPDVPEEIEYQLARTEFIVSKLIDGVDDPNTEDEGGGAVDAPITFEKYPLFGGNYSTSNKHMFTGNMH